MSVHDRDPGMNQVVKSSGLMYHVFAVDAAYMDAEEFVENTMTAKENSKRDGVLDLMKIVATLCIVLHHYQQLTGAKWQGFNFWEDEHFYFGYLVELFFLISGIVSYADIEKIRKGKTLGSYWGRKYLRFLPTVALSAVCYEGLMIFFKLSTGTAYPGNEISLGGTLITALSVQRWVFPDPGINDPVWYISVLLLCYLILFMLVRISEKHGEWEFEFSCIIMILLGCAVVTNGWNFPMLNLHTGRGFYAFFYGILIKEVMDRWKSVSRYLIAGSIFIAFTLILVFCPDITKAGLSEGYGTNLVLLFLYFPAMILFFDNPFLSPVFDGRWTTLAARISLGVFIWHYVLHTAFIIGMVTTNRYYDVSAPVIVILIVVTDYLAGILSYCLIEKNFMKYINKRTKDDYNSDKGGSCL